MIIDKQPTSSFLQRLSSSAIISTAAIVALIVCWSLAIFVAHVEAKYQAQRTHDRAARGAEAVARVYEMAVTRADSIIQLMSQMSNLRNTADMTDNLTYHAMAAFVSNAQEIRAVAHYDWGGSVVNGAVMTPDQGIQRLSPHLSATGQDFFSFAVNTPTPELHLGEALIGRISGATLLPVSRATYAMDGSLESVFTVSIHRAVLEHLIDMALGDGPVMARVLRRDDTVLLSWLRTEAAQAATAATSAALLAPVPAAHDLAASDAGWRSPSWFGPSVWATPLPDGDHQPAPRAMDPAFARRCMEVRVDPYAPGAIECHQTVLNGAARIEVRIPLETAAFFKPGANSGAVIGITLTCLIGLLVLAVRLGGVREQRDRLNALVTERTTALKGANEALDHTEALFRKVVDASPVALLMVRFDGTIEAANPASGDLLGVLKDKLPGLKLQHFIADGPSALARAEAGGLSDHETRMRSLGGQETWGNLSAVTVELGANAYLLFTIADITARKKAEDERVAALQRAEAADAAKSRFFAAASHDLRQPVQSLFFLSGSLGQQLTDQRALATLRHIDDSLDALKGLLDSLMDISKMEAGMFKPTVEEFPIASLLDQVLAEYAGRAQEKALEFHVPPTAALVRSDRHLLGRMVRNMVENAIRYTPAGRVEVLCDAHDGALRIAVRDTGVGIPADKLDAIFEEFLQLGNQERDRTQGYGLGLSIVQRLARLLEHPLSVTSELGQGSTFTLSVPLAVAPANQQGSVATAEDCCQTVAVVEDDPLVRCAVEAMLRQWNFEVVAAPSGSELLAALGTVRCVPVAILADYRLVGETGVQVILDIRRFYQSPIPAIVITGDTGDHCQIEATPHGIQVHRKPITPAKLRAAMSAMLAGTERPHTMSAA